MEQHQQPLAVTLGGDQRRAVGERCPGAVGEQRIGLGQNLAADGDIVRHRHAGERAFARESGELLRLFPAQAAAQDAAAAAQLHRHQVVVGGAGEVRTGKAHQHAAIVDPFVELLARLSDIADIGEDQHRQMLIEEALHRFGRRHALGEADIGERIERARQVIAGADQRLRAVGGRTGHDADGAPAPALVEQLHGARRALCGDLQPRHVVADFDRQIDHRLGFLRVGSKRERRLAERQTFKIDGIHKAGVGAAGLRAQHFHRQRASRVVGGSERMRDGKTARDHGERMAADDVLQARDEFAALAEIDAVGEPDDLDVRCGCEEALDQGQRLGALDGIGLRLELFDLHAGGAGDLQGNIARGFRQRQHGDAAVVGLGPRHQLVGGAQAGVPGGRRAPAVIEHDQQRCPSARRGERRVPQRPCCSDDDQRGKRQPQQDKPPRRARRGFLLGRDLEQQPGRREVDAARARRHQPQQPPQDRQADQAEQHQRLCEAERQRTEQGADHATLPGCAGV